MLIGGIAVIDVLIYVVSQKELVFIECYFGDIIDADSDLLEVVAKDTGVFGAMVAA
jgi:hypothetical protein